MNLYRGSLFAVIATLAVHSTAISQDGIKTAPESGSSSMFPETTRLSRIEANHGLADSPQLSVTKRVARLECLLLGREIVGPINKRLTELERIDKLSGRHPEKKSQGISSSSFNTSGLSSPIQIATGTSGGSGASATSSAVPRPLPAGSDRFAPSVQSASVPRSPSVSSPYTKREMTVLSPRSRNQGVAASTQRSHGLSPITAAPKGKASGASSYTQGASTLSPLPISRPSAEDCIATTSPTVNAGRVGSTVQNFKWTRDESKLYFPDGANIIVDKNSAAAAYDCMKGSAIINASNCDLTFRGSYKQITVRGSNNKIVLHNASAVAVNGNANTIFWTSDNAPKILDSGTKNSITRRQ